LHTVGDPRRSLRLLGMTVAVVMRLLGTTVAVVMRLLGTTVAIVMRLLGMTVAIVMRLLGMTVAVVMPSRVSGVWASPGRSPTLTSFAGDDATDPNVPFRLETRQRFSFLQTHLYFQFHHLQ